MSGHSYRSWEIVTIDSPGGGIAVATKPGVIAHGRVDSTALLLATHVRVEQDDIAVVMGSDNGFVPAALARSGRSSRIVCTDRNILSVEATTRSLASNNAVNTEVVAQHGAFGVVGDSSADTVAIRVPHEKIAFVQLLFDAFRALKHGGTCYVAGATNEGIKSAGRLLERAFGNVVLIAYEGGSRILSATKNSNAPFDDTIFESPFASFDPFRELNVTLRGHDLKLFSRPGVFPGIISTRPPRFLPIKSRFDPENRFSILAAEAGLSEFPGLRDRPETSTIPARVLTRHEAQVAGELPGTLEAAPVDDFGGQHHC